MSERATSTTLSATFVVTADDLLASSRYAERGALPLLYITAAMAALIGVVLIAWQPMVGAVGLGLGIGIASLPLLPAFWRWWLTRQARDLLGEERRISFDADGLHEERAGIRHTTPWSLLTVMRVTRDGIFLLRDRHVVLAIPARAFGSPDDVDRLIELVSANASSIRIT
jgi:hypothetical protein